MTDARIEAATLALLHSNNYEMPGFSTEDLQKALVSEHSGHGEILFTCKRCLCHMAQRQAKAMLEAADAAAWRPIESAPRDGTHILVPMKFIGADVVSYDLGAWRETTSMLRLKEEPTHWQPLPAPPTKETTP